MVWYGGQFYALFFLTQTIKVAAVPAQIMIVIALALGTPFFIIFGMLSDKIGRKPIILAGFLLAAVTYFPIFKGITYFANPKLEAALSASPVTVIADPNECSFQFKATGTEKFTTSCDVAKAALVTASVNYNNEAAPAGTKAKVKIGDQTLDATSPTFAKDFTAAIKAHGYPATADPNEINYVMTTVLLWILVIYVTLVYAPIAAWLVELFPSRIRYTGMSLPYHIGNGWFGGFLPATVFAIAAATGNIYSGLWYPVVVAVMSLVDRLPVPARDQGRRHHQDLIVRTFAFDPSAAERSAADFHLAGADELQHDLAPVRTGAMLDQIDRLPGAERHLAIDAPGSAASRRQHGLDMRGHVVRPFGVMSPAGIFGRKARKRRLQIREHGRIGVFLDRQRCRGVADEQCHRAFSRIRSRTKFDRPRR